MDLKEKLRTLPKKPGIYMHKDASGTVIYVGKAINLFNRVNSYFVGAHDYKTTKLVSNIKDFDYIVTKSEKEALILEYNLIKQYDPKFNIVFKDDKSYPYILLKDCKEPYVSVVRLKKKSKYKGKLFGPFPDVGAARNLVDLINKLFPTRKCENLQNDLCLYFHIKQCPGYCIYGVDENADKIKEEISSLLNGNTKEIVKNLKEKMLKASDDLDFENATRYRDLINDINQTVLKQDIQKNNRETFDVFNYDVSDGFYVWDTSNDALIAMHGITGGQEASVAMVQNHTYKITRIASKARVEYVGYSGHVLTGANTAFAHSQLQAAFEYIDENLKKNTCFWQN